MGYNQPNEAFKTIMQDVKSTGTPYRLTVRQLVQYFSQERRSYLVISWIRHNLDSYGLETKPDFENVYIDSEIEIIKNESLQTIGAIQKAKDPITRLALLPAANKVPVSINRDAEIKQAITLMLLHDFSQLPVMQNEGPAEGMITFRSIISSQASGAKPQFVKDCMNRDVTIKPLDAPLFDAVRAVMSEEVILVHTTDNKICGLVTIADIGAQFVSLSEPFLILGHLENHVRSLFDKITLDQIKAVIGDSIFGREIKHVSDLTFGSYVRLLENLSIWESLKLEIDRSVFTRRLEEVRQIRNDVMHFHPDGISSPDMELLRETLKFFYNLTRHQAIEI